VSDRAAVNKLTELVTSRYLIRPRQPHQHSKPHSLICRPVDHL